MITDVVRPATLEEALAAKVAETAVLAGGTDLVPMYRAGTVSARRLIDMSPIAELRSVDAAPTGTRIGALVLASQAAREIAGPYHALADGAGLIGSRQTQNMATVGGNLCRASPSGDTIAAVLVCSGAMHARSARGNRDIDSRDFFLGPGWTALADDELLVGLSLPMFSGASAYARATVRNAMDLATVGVAMAIDVSPADGRMDESTPVRLRVAVGGAGPRVVPLPDDSGPWASLTLGEARAVLPSVDSALQAAVSPIDDVRASEWYRRRAITFLLRRVFEIAVARLPINERNGS